MTTDKLLTCALAFIALLLTACVDITFPDDIGEDEDGNTTSTSGTDEADGTTDESTSGDASTGTDESTSSTPDLPADETAATDTTDSTSETGVEDLSACCSCADGTNNCVVAEGPRECDGVWTFVEGCAFAGDDLGCPFECPFD